MIQILHTKYIKVGKVGINFHHNGESPLSLSIS